MALPDQLIDRTRGTRPATFFGGGIVAHIAFDTPFCPALRAALAGVGAATAHTRRHARCHRGPRVLDARRVGAVPSVGRRPHRDDGAPGGEARPRSRHLLRRRSPASPTTTRGTRTTTHVTADMIIGNLLKNVAHARRIVSAAVARAPVRARMRLCRCARHRASSRRCELVPEDVKRDLAPILARRAEAGGADMTVVERKGVAAGGARRVRRAREPRPPRDARVARSEAPVRRVRARSARPAAVPRCPSGGPPRVTPAAASCCTRAAVSATPYSRMGEAGAARSGCCVCIPAPASTFLTCETQHRRHRRAATSRSRRSRR